MEKGKKASKYLRESREIISSCCSKQIKAQAALEHFFLAIQEKSDKINDKEEREIESEMEKMKATLDSLVKGTERLERTWLRGIPATTYRAEKGRKDTHGNDSGFVSVDSTVIPREEPGSPKDSTIVAQATLDPNDKHPSDSFDISLTGPVDLPSMRITHTTDKGKGIDDSLVLHHTADGLGPNKVNTISRQPSEHEDDGRNQDTQNAVDNDNKESSKSLGSLSKCDENNEGKNDNDKCNITKETDRGDNAQKKEAQPKDTGTEKVTEAVGVRSSSAFAARLGDDKEFLETQGDHQKRRQKKSKDKFNSL